MEKGVYHHLQLLCNTECIAWLLPQHCRLSLRVLNPSIHTLSAIGYNLLQENNGSNISHFHGGMRQHSPLMVATSNRCVPKFTQLFLKMSARREHHEPIFSVIFMFFAPCFRQGFLFFLVGDYVTNQ